MYQGNSALKVEVTKISGDQDQTKYWHQSNPSDELRLPCLAPRAYLLHIGYGQSFFQLTHLFMLQLMHVCDTMYTIPSTHLYI